MNSWAAVAVAMLGAVASIGCGGASRSDGSGASGGASGSGGNGGVGGNGNGGVGNGGVGNGGVGNGGVGAGGGEGGSAGSIQDQIEALCAEIDQLPCAVDHCVEDISEAEQIASANGCSGEFAALVACGLAHPMSCVAGEDAPQFDFACQSQLMAFQECGGSSGSCSAGAGPSGCDIWCDGPQGYSASCTTTASGNGLSCTCTSGPNSGVTFTLAGTCSDGAWSSAVEAQCSGG